MPHKANAACRHHIPRAKRRVTNWAEYDSLSPYPPLFPNIPQTQ